jgi:hypothetical protein
MSGGEARAPKMGGGAPKGGSPKGVPKGSTEHAGMEDMEMVSAEERYTAAIAGSQALKGCPESLGLDIKNVGTGGHVSIPFPLILVMLLTPSR